MNEHLQMKPVTIYFQEIQYLMYQELARQQGKKAAELIREAMSEYLERKTSCAKKHSDWKPISLGGLKADGDWISKENSIIGIYNQSFLEYQHVVTDSKRFNSPLTMEQAIERSWYWIDNEKVRIVYEDNNSLKRAKLWMNMYGLGRKRIQNTHMASAFLSSNIDRIITANPKNFEIFEAFEIIGY